MLEFTNLIGAIGLEALFQSSRGDPRLVATNADRREFVASFTMCAIHPTDALGLLQMRRPVGFVKGAAPAPVNGVPNSLFGR